MGSMVLKQGPPCVITGIVRTTSARTARQDMSTMLPPTRPGTAHCLRFLVLSSRGSNSTKEEPDLGAQCRRRVNEFFGCELQARVGHPGDCSIDKRLISKADRTAVSTGAAQTRLA